MGDVERSTGGRTSSGRAWVALAACGLAACAPAVIRPPATPNGFLAPPRVTYAGVLARAGASFGADAAAVPSTIELELADGARAVVHVGPDCALPAAVVTAPYADVPGQGFLRRADGVLTIDAGATCALDGGAALTVSSGNVSLPMSGYGELWAAGADASGVPASLHFTGTVTAEREADAAAPTGSTVVHVLAELVTPCRSCSANRRSLDDPTAFPYTAALERSNADVGGEGWTRVCVAPCTARLDAGPRLRVAGEGFAASRPFALPEGRPRLALKASGTGRAAHLFGMGFVVAGTTYVAIGTAALLVGALSPRGTQAERGRANGELIFGAAFAAGSLGFYIPGLLVLHREGTTVTTDAGQTLAVP